MPNKNEELVKETYRFSQTKIGELYRVVYPDPGKTYKQLVDIIRALEECLKTLYDNAKN